MRIETPTCPKCGKNATWFVEHVFSYEVIRVASPDGRADNGRRDQCFPDLSVPYAKTEGLTKVECEQGHQWISCVDQS